MNSRALVVGSIAVGIAIGYIAGFLTYYSELSKVTGVNVAAVEDELDQLKQDLEKTSVRLSLASEDNEKLRTDLAQARANSEALQKHVDALQSAFNEPSGSLTKIGRGIMLLQKISEPQPFEELAGWRVAVLDNSAALDPKLVPTMLKLVDSWSDVVEFEEQEPEPETPEWIAWNDEWQQKALVYVTANNEAAKAVTDLLVSEIQALEASLRP